MEASEIIQAKEVLRQRADALVRQLAVLRRRPTAEAVHDTRVLSRRTRAALEVFRPLFTPEQWQVCYAAARRITRSLGKVRETEVILSLVSSLTTGRRAAENISREYVEERLRRRLSKLKKRMKKDLSGTDTATLQLQFEGLAGELETTQPRAENAESAAPHAETGSASLECHSARPAAGGTPGLRARQVLAEVALPVMVVRTGSTFSRASDTRLHRLRIEVKRLRYAMEILTADWPGGLDKEIELARVLQDAVGVHHDWAVLQDRLKREIRRLTKHKTTHLAFQAGRLAARIEERKLELRRQVAPAFAALRVVLEKLFEGEQPQNSISAGNTGKKRAAPAGRRVTAKRASAARSHSKS